MRKSLKSTKNKGYTLIEVAIVLIILGLIIAPATHIYTLYIKHQQAEKTKTALLETRGAIGNFRSIYGRYPCPAPLNAVPGDASYGRESRNITTGECEEVLDGVWKAASNNAALSNPDIFIGAIPFRQMNLPDSFIHDGYGNQLTYAITGLLTNDVTYSDRDGGISLMDLDTPAISAITPPDTAHFVILSHNSEDSGAMTRAGVQTGTCSATLEGENCNRDAVFRVGEKTQGFDDLLYFNISDSIEQWQLSNSDIQDIHLRRSDSIAMGINESTATGSFVEAEIKNTSPALSDGTLRVELDATNALSGAILTSAICEETGVDCFSSKLIAGQITDGEGMDCSPGYLVGIANSAPICSNEITFSCPSGEFVTGFNANGNVVCSAAPPTPCVASGIATSCGPIRSINPVFLNGQYYGYGYSGECHMIANIDTLVVDNIIISAANSADAETQLNAYVDGLNNAPRSTQSCGSNASNAMIRDTYQCDNGSWEITPVNTLERVDLGTNLASFDPLYNSSPYPAEIGGSSYVPINPMGVDQNNDASDHDCWCREDYRLVTNDCSAGTILGQSFRIEKHSCPQSGNDWQQVYPASGNFNTKFCPTCIAGPSQTSQSCKSVFGLPANNIGVTGDAIFKFNTTCTSPFDPPVTTADPNNPYLDACTCPAQATPLITTEACPFGQTNSFTFGGDPYTGVAKIFHQDWVCPSGTAPVTPITSATEAGSYQPKQLVHTQACSCDSSLTQYHREDCPAGFQGSGKHWNLAFDCTTGTFEDPSTRLPDTNDCRRCIWQAGTKRSGTSSSGAAVELGAACSSCNGTSSCHEVVGAGPVFEVWDGCYCAGQP